MMSKLNFQSGKRIWLAIVILILAGSLSFIVYEARSTQVYRVGILSGIDTFASTADGFIAGMTEAGYVEGQNIIYEVHKVNADPVKTRQVLQEFVTADVDLIFVFPSNIIAAAKSATEGTDIPVVFDIATLEGNDLVESVRHPGGNITGVRYPGPDRAVKRLELLLDMAPNTSRVWLVVNPKHPATVGTMEVLRTAASSRNITLVEVTITSVDDIEADLQARREADEIGVDAILIMPENIGQSPASWEAIRTFAAEHNLPIAGNTTSQVEQGAVFSYIPDNFEAGKLAAPLAAKILRGTPAGTIPVVTAESRLYINYKAAQELGLEISDGLLRQAVEIIR